MDPSLLPELGTGIPQDPLTKLFGPGLAEVIRRRELAGQLGSLDLQLNRKGLNGQMPLLGGQVKGLLDYGGDVKLNYQRPLFGGLLNFDATRNDGQNSLWLNYQRNF